MDDEHVLALVEAVDRTYLDTVHVLALDTALVDDVGQLSVLSAVRRGKGDFRVVESLCASSTVNGLR